MLRDKVLEISAGVILEVQEREGLVRSLGEYVAPVVDTRDYIDVEEYGNGRRW